jgi:hypothetical protein
VIGVDIQGHLEGLHSFWNVPQLHVTNGDAVWNIGVGAIEPTGDGKCINCGQGITLP